MMKKPIVSVILPVYNGEKYVARAIESVRRQTFRNWELIIVDDGSKDNSTSIINDYVRIDKRIRLLHHLRNRGVVAARNSGLSGARGLFVAWMDHDDEWTSRDKLGIQVAFLKLHSDVVLVGTNVRIVDWEGRHIRNPIVAASDSQIRRLMLFRNPFFQPTVVFRRSILRKVGLCPSWPRLAEDYHFWLRVGTYGKMANLRRVTVRVRELRTGLTRSNYWKRYWATVFLVWKYRRDYPHGWLALFKNLTERFLGFLYRPLKRIWIGGQW